MKRQTKPNGPPEPEATTRHRVGLRRRLFAQHSAAAEEFFLTRWQTDWDLRLRELIDAAIRFSRLHADWLVGEILRQDPNAPTFLPEEVGRSQDFDYLASLLRRPHPRGLIRQLSLGCAVTMSVAYYKEDRRAQRRTLARKRLKRLQHRTRVRQRWRMRCSERARRESPVLARFYSGHTLHLLSGPDLHAESAAMHNCIETMAEPGLLHFSLRNRDGASCANFTLCSSTLLEVKGVGNEYPTEVARPVTIALNFLTTRFGLQLELPEYPDDESGALDYEIWMQLAWGVRDAAARYGERRVRLMEEHRGGQMQLALALG